MFHTSKRAHRVGLTVHFLNSLPLKMAAHYTEVYRSIQKYAEVCRSIQKYAEVYRSMQKYTEVYRSMQKYTEVCRSMQKLPTRWRHMTPSVAAISWTTSYFSFTCDMQCISQRSNNSYRADHGPVESYLICQWKNYGGIVPHTYNNEKSTLASHAKQKSPQSSKLWAYVNSWILPTT